PSFRRRASVRRRRAASLDPPGLGPAVERRLRRLPARPRHREKRETGGVEPWDPVLCGPLPRLRRLVVSRRRLFASRRRLLLALARRVVLVRGLRERQQDLAQQLARLGQPQLLRRRGRRTSRWRRRG